MIKGTITAKKNKSVEKEKNKAETVNRITSAYLYKINCITCITLSPLRFCIL